MVQLKKKCCCGGVQEPICPLDCAGCLTSYTATITGMEWVTGNACGGVYNITSEPMERFLDLCNYSTTVCQCICDLGGACCPTVDPGSYALTQSFIQCVPTVPAYWEVSFVFRTSPFHQLTVRYRRPALNDCPVGDYVYDSHDFEGFGSWEVPNFGTVEVL